MERNSAAGSLQRTENGQFIEYYQAQKVCPKNEFKQFIEHIQRPVPVSFIISSSKGVARALTEIVKYHLMRLCTVLESENKPCLDIEHIPWYPNELAWRLDLPGVAGKELKKHYPSLYRYIGAGIECGAIFLQETAEMIPALLLGIESHHKILDMCAAPGCKTVQILEFLHATSDSPTGYVVANDIDDIGCQCLTQRAKKLNSPCLALTNHDSMIYPTLVESLPDGSKRQVEFDRVLCDVPSSQDGNVRTTPTVLRNWIVGSGLRFHETQYRILKKGCELLAVGGRLVYTNCSLNPIENEAVIHRVLKETRGALKLIEINGIISGLRSTPGLESWLVPSLYLDFYKKFKHVDPKWHTVIIPEMFAPKKRNRSRYKLNRCMRILPHHQNTCAIFVAVLEKIEPIDQDMFERETYHRKFSFAKNRIFKRFREGYRQNPFSFLEADDPAWVFDIKPFYDIGSFDHTCLITRDPGNAHQNRTFYLTSEMVRDLIRQNPTIKFFNTGVRTFVRLHRNQNYGIATEGLENIFPYMGEARKVYVCKNDLCRILTNSEDFLDFTSLSEEVQQQLNNLSLGTCILVYKHEDEVLLHFPAWRGNTILTNDMEKYFVQNLPLILWPDTIEDDAKETR